MLFTEDGKSDRVAAIELKSGDVDVSDVRAQLQSGAAIIEQLVSPVDEVIFYPVVASREISRLQLQALARVAIRFRGNRYDVIRVKCDTSFDEIVRRFG